MKKGFYFLLIMMGVAIAVASCDDTRSYTDMLNAQRDMMDKLIADSGFVILSDFPADSVLEPNEFVEIDDNFYMNIIDKGNSSRAVVGQTDIQCRFIPYIFSSDSDRWMQSVSNLGPNSNGTHPLEFKYGYTVPIYSYVPYEYFLGAGLSTPLTYVGDSSYVRLIVPFEMLGSDFQSSGTPVFFDRVRYIFKK